MSPFKNSSKPWLLSSVVVLSLWLLCSFPECYGEFNIDEAEMDIANNPHMVQGARRTKHDDGGKKSPTAPAPAPAPAAPVTLCPSAPSSPASAFPPFGKKGGKGGKKTIPLSTECATGSPTSPGPTDSPTTAPPTESPTTASPTVSPTSASPTTAAPTSSTESPTIAPTTGKKGKGGGGMGKKGLGADSGKKGISPAALALAGVGAPTDPPSGGSLLNLFSSITESPSEQKMKKRMMMMSMKNNKRQMMMGMGMGMGKKDLLADLFG